MTDIGYTRVRDNRMWVDAVQWWYFWEYDDGWAFARGGRCRTLREARRLIRNCHGERQRERQAFLDRPKLLLTEDGIVPIARSPYDTGR